MNRFVWLLPVAVLATVAAFAIAQEKKEKKELEKVTLSGQVIDLACYLGLDALAGDHQQCAELCVKNGATTGFKTKDHTYVVVRDPMHQKDAPGLTRFVNKEVEISANVFEKDGIRGVKILSIQASTRQ